MSESTSNNTGQTNNNVGSSSTTVITTQVPGVDMTQVIASSPHLVKENSAKVETKVINEVRRK